MKISVLGIFLLSTVISFAQSQKKQNIRFYGKDSFLIEGIAFTDSARESPYDRFPLSAKGKVREAVWNLSKNSAGLAIRFSTNSSSISVKWKLMSGFTMNHMAATGIKGIDLYGKVDDHWQYINTGRPQGMENEALLVENMPGEWREYKMFLPLYDGVTNLEVGIDSMAEIRKPPKMQGKPIVFYGTSITQGGCASRPGMVYTSIISRKLSAECLNFGFSGNGKMEKEVVDLISEINAAFYVIDCVPNMQAGEIRERVIPLVETIRQKHPGSPVVFVEGPVYEKAFFDNEQMSMVNEKNRALYDSYQKLIESGTKNIYYINNKFSFDSDHEGTVDGTHLTDLGFMRFADYLISKFDKYKLLKYLEPDTRMKH
jgi:GDSL-like Lipase/Acylhydrolase family/N-terminus of Esterase_SGNH_hydro-type